MAKSKVTAKRPNKLPRHCRRAGKPYRLPRLFGVLPSPQEVQFDSQVVTMLAWEATIGKGPCATGERAVREWLSRVHLLPSTLDDMARWLADYNTAWPRNDAEAEALAGDWFVAGHGCTQRKGTVREAHLAAWHALYAISAVLLELPITDAEDETWLFATMQHIGWRMPERLRERAAERFAKHIAVLCIRDRRFVPIGAAE
jgi:hypothetical protein